MVEASALAQLLGLAGVQVDVVEREADGSWTAHVTTAPEQPACCPECGQTGRPKQPTMHDLKHLVLVPMRISWHKSRFHCDNTACQRGSFAESGPVAGAAVVVSTPAKTVMGHLVGDWLVPVARVAAGAGVGWHTAHDAFVAVAEQAGIHVATPGTGMQTTPDPEVESGPESGVEVESDAEIGAQTAAGADAAAAAGEDTDPGSRRPWRAVSGPLPAVEVLGIDDHRRGKPLYHRNAATGRWVADADRWQSVFVDSVGGHGLLGQVEGRAKADVIGWLAAQDPTWLARIRYATIDMSTVYKSAVLAGLLPNALPIVDLFHLIQLANTMVGDVRRRVTYARYGRRGRAGDPEYTIKNPLRRGQEKLSKTARHKLLCTLADLSDAGRQIGAAWRAKELLRDLVKLSPNHTGLAATRDKVSNALEKFFTFAATTGATIPEIQTLAETVSTWRAEITRGVLTGHSNAAAEAINRLVKLVYRTAYGFRNVTNQQRRSRYAASRTTRPEWLHTVTTRSSQPVAA